MTEEELAYQEAAKTNTYRESQVYAIPLDVIFADETFNVRGAIQPMDVLELAKEINKNGLIQPVTVQTFNRVDLPNKKFRLVAGYRRYKAHQVNSATTIRALVKVGIDDLQARLLNLIENTQREELNILQEAKAIEHFKWAGWTQDEIGSKVGKGRGWTQIRLYLLDMPEEVQNEAAAGTINGADIREIWQLRDFGYDAQMAALRKMKNDRQLGKSRQAKADEFKPKKSEKKARTREEMFEMQEIIQNALTVSDWGAKCLAWAAGEISDYDLHVALERVAREQGKFYLIPESLKFNEVEPILGSI